MCRITSIKRQTKNKKRVSIFVNGSYFGSLDEKTFLESELKSGDIIDDDKWQKLVITGEARIAFNKGISYISKMMRSEKQVRRYLEKKGFEDTAIDYAIDKMSNYNYIDDQSFAKMILSHQINVKHAGRLAINQAFYKNGISKDIADKMLNNFDDEMQFENAKIIAEKLIKKYKNIEDKYEKKRKITQGMLRRGHTWEMIISALENLNNSKN